jgi:GH25 family lysozyme M1 (1,4-beta-N-acetylmuramidase)
LVSSRWKIQFDHFFRVLDRTTNEADWSIYVMAIWMSPNYVIIFERKEPDNQDIDWECLDRHNLRQRDQGFAWYTLISKATEGRWPIPPEITNMLRYSLF